MRHIRLLGLALLLAAPLPAAAGSQSSNSSSNCSNGRCSRVGTYAEEGRGYRWGERREERWRERTGPPSWAREGAYWPAPPRVREGRPRDDGPRQRRRWRRDND